MEYATGTLEYMVNPVDVIPDIPSKYASINDKSRDNNIGNAQNSADIIHIDNTKINDPFNDKLDKFLELNDKYNINPVANEIIVEYINELR